MARKNVLEVEGEVLECLQNELYRVVLPNGHLLTGHVDGKMRGELIRILPGEKVLLQVSPFDLSKGRITFRAK